MERDGLAGSGLLAGVAAGGWLGPNAEDHCSDACTVPAPAAGVAAAYLSANPDALPRDVSAALISTATLDKIVSTRFKPGTPNRLLYSRLGAPTVVAAASGP